VPGSDKYRIRMVDAREAYESCDAVFNAAVTSRPGMLARDSRWKEQPLADYEFARHGAGPLRCVVAEAPDGSVAAYARYRVKECEGTPGRPGSKVMLNEAYGRDAASYAAIWRYLLDIDLTDEVLVSDYGIAVDDPILHLLANTRSAQPRLVDATYTRLVDLDRALASRRYSTPIDVVFEVVDTFCPWNAGRWRLSGDESGAVCSRTTDPADVLLGVRELGSAYLGGVTLTTLGRAARVEELRSGALAAASLAFASDPAPFLPFGF
jgi:predicted acetyltransferase